MAYPGPTPEPANPKIHKPLIYKRFLNPLSA